MEMTVTVNKKHGRTFQIRHVNHLFSRKGGEGGGDMQTSRV